MVRRRKTNDGLPHRLYERHGKRDYSIGYKQPNGKWAFRFRAPTDNDQEIRQVRQKAIEEANKLNSGAPSGGKSAELIDDWFEHQDRLPMNSAERRAESTLKENRREANNLKAAFGHMYPNEITRTHGYEYLEACVEANRPIKGNKEISLFHVIIEFWIKRGWLDKNPLSGITKNKTKAPKRYVEDHELDLAVEMGRKLGRGSHIVAMALKTAYLTVRRSVEIRGLTRDRITDEGIIWVDGKDSNKKNRLSEWTEELKKTISEALTIDRYEGHGTFYVFGNLKGQKYTKGGWKSVLDKLMKACESEALERGIEFRRFSLQDCRPKGVSDKLEAGHGDILDATGHTSNKMVKQVYDRRKVAKFKPVK